MWNSVKEKDISVLGHIFTDVRFSVLDFMLKIAVYYFQANGTGKSFLRFTKTKRTWQGWACWFISGHV